MTDEPAKPVGDSPLDKIRRRFAATAPPDLSGFADTVPDVDQEREPDELDRLVKGMSIVMAYTRWCGKTTPRVGNKEEGIKVSCPNPDHEDNDPSAWLNTRKNLGNCAVCGGFDQWDIFAWSRGFSVPAYRRERGQFPEVRKLIAPEFGLDLHRTVTGSEYVTPSEPVDNEPEPVDDEGSTRVTEGEEEGAVLALLGPEPEVSFTTDGIDWRSLLDEQSTFLVPWMELCATDDQPDEFYFWQGLQAIGFALGNGTQLVDRRPVRGNLMVCLVGASGSGKSLSTHALRDLIDTAFPWDPEVGGVLMVANPGSGESLIDEFRVPILDDQGTVTGHLPVKGLLTINELASLMGKAQRHGSTLRATIMDFYDSPGPIVGRSRTSGRVSARDHFLQVLTTTQPKLISRYLGDEDALGGFVNRWVFVPGVKKHRIAIGGHLLDVGELAEPLKSIYVWAKDNPRIALDREAIAEWEAFFYSTLDPLKDREDSPTIARADLLFKKIMLLVAADKKKGYVGVETVRQALSLWPYLSAIYGFVDEQTTVVAERREAYEAQQRIINGVKRCKERSGQEPTKRELQRTLEPWWSRNLGLVEKTMKLLENLGEIETFADHRKKGRPTYRFRVGE